MYILGREINKKRILPKICGFFPCRLGEVGLTWRKVERSGLVRVLRFGVFSFQEERWGERSDLCVHYGFHPAGDICNKVRAAWKPCLGSWLSRRLVILSNIWRTLADVHGWGSIERIARRGQHTTRLFQHKKKATKRCLTQTRNRP